MPYYVYKITEKPLRLLEKLNEFAVFREASTYAKSRRGEAGPNTLVKVMFAENELQAEEALNEVREAPPMIGDDY
jgi:hypothetical protein